MTVQSELNVQEFIGDGVRVDFIFTIQASHPDWMYGAVDNVSVSVSTVLNEDQEASPGGTMTFAVAPADQSIVQVLRDVPLDQSLDLESYTAFPAEAVEAALDKMTMTLQQFVSNVGNQIIHGVWNFVSGLIVGNNAPILFSSLADATTPDNTGVWRVINDINDEWSLQVSDGAGAWVDVLRGLPNNEATMNSLNVALSPANNTSATSRQYVDDLVSAIIGGLNFLGYWDCSGGLLPAPAVNGDFYKVSIGGVVNVSNGIDPPSPSLMAEGDTLLYSGDNSWWVGLHVSSADRMRWLGQWVQQDYQYNDVVLDNGWTMVALVDTDDRAAPVPVGDPIYDLPEVPDFIEDSDIALVRVAHFYTFTKSGWSRTIEIWLAEVGANIHHELEYVLNPNSPNPVYEVVALPALLTANEWNLITLPTGAISAGTEVLIVLTVLNNADDTLITGGWTFGGTSNGAPGANQWNRTNNGSTLRIDNVDLDLVDRHTELLSFAPGSTVQFVDVGDANSSVTYRVEAAPVDNTTYVSYSITQVSQGVGGSPGTGIVCQMNATVPVPLATAYEEDTDFWIANQPDWATVVGQKDIDGVPVVNDDAAFGIRMSFQEAYISPDWDVVAPSTSVGGGGSPPVTADTGDAITVLFENLAGVATGTPIDWSAFGNLSDYDEIMITVFGNGDPVIAGLDSSTFTPNQLLSRGDCRIGGTTAGGSSSNQTVGGLDNITETGADAFGLTAGTLSTVLTGIYGIKKMQTFAAPVSARIKLFEAPVGTTVPDATLIDWSATGSVISDFDLILIEADVVGSANSGGNLGLQALMVTSEAFLNPINTSGVVTIVSNAAAGSSSNFSRVSVDTTTETTCTTKYSMTSYSGGIRAIYGITMQYTQDVIPKGITTLHENLAGDDDEVAIDWTGTGFIISDFDMILVTGFTTGDASGGTFSQYINPVQYFNQTQMSICHTVAAGTNTAGARVVLKELTETTARVNVSQSQWTGRFTGIYGIKF